MFSGALCSTSSTASSLPTSMPAATATSMPFRFPVPGTTTLLTFLTMLPLTFAVTRSGIPPSVLRHSAAP